MLVRLIGLFLLCWLASFLLVRTMLTSRTDRSQVEQMAGILANNIALTELALEHYPPPAVSQLNGFQLLVTNRPSLSGSDDRRLGAQLERLSHDLCDRLGHCPTLVPHPGKVRGVWIRIRSSLEPVWLFSPLPAQGLFSPDPLVITLSMLGGSVLAGGLFLLLEVQRPLKHLSAAIARVGTCEGEAMVPLSGSSEVRQL
ncbi:MAG: histidine kinase, partial [Vulcanococcus sp.]